MGDSGAGGKEYGLSMEQDIGRDGDGAAGVAREAFAGWSRAGGPGGVRWLDHAATTPRLRCALDAEAEFYARRNANPGRGLHRLGVEASEALEGARARVRRFAGDADGVGEVVFVRGTTEALNLVAGGVGASAEVWVGGAEHHSNLLPWWRAAKAVHVAALTEAGDIDVAALEASLAASGAQEKWVAFSAVSNVIGRVQDVGRICAAARTAGARSVVDAAQAAFHVPLRAAEWGCDFLAFSGHKMGGPMGIGALWGRRAALEGLPAGQLGGEMVLDVEAEGAEWELADVPARFEAGTVNAAGAVGLAAAADWVAGRSAEEHRRVAELAWRAAAELVRLGGVRVLGGAEEGDGVGARASLVTFVVEGVHAHDVAQWLDGDGIAVRGGRLCAHPLLRRLGVDAAVRASFGPVNDEGDVAALVASVRRVQEALA